MQIRTHESSHARMHDPEGYLTVHFRLDGLNPETSTVVDVILSNESRPSFVGPQFQLENSHHSGASGFSFRFRPAVVAGTLEAKLLIKVRDNITQADRYLETYVSIRMDNPFRELSDANRTDQLCILNRDDLVQTFSDVIGHDSRPYISVVGPVGVGKTTFLRQWSALAHTNELLRVLLVTMEDPPAERWQYWEFVARLDGAVHRALREYVHLQLESGAEPVLLSHAQKRFIESGVRSDQHYQLNVARTHSDYVASFLRFMRFLDTEPTPMLAQSAGFARPSNETVDRDEESATDQRLPQVVIVIDEIVLESAEQLGAILFWVQRIAKRRQPSVRLVLSTSLAIEDYWTFFDISSHGAGSPFPPIVMEYLGAMASSERWSDYCVSFPSNGQFPLLSAHDIKALIQSRIGDCQEAQWWTPLLYRYIARMTGGNARVTVSLLRLRWQGAAASGWFDRQRHTSEDSRVRYLGTLLRDVAKSHAQHERSPLRSYISNQIRFPVAEEHRVLVESLLRSLSMACSDSPDAGITATEWLEPLRLEDDFGFIERLVRCGVVERMGPSASPSVRYHFSIPALHFVVGPRFRLSDSRA